MTSKHTPLPWHLSGLEIKARIKTDYGEKSLFVASVIKHGYKPTREEYESAEFIVRACNSHYDLLEACEEIHKRYGHEIAGPHNTGTRPDICFLCAAIAKATQGEA